VGGVPTISKTIIDSSVLTRFNSIRQKRLATCLKRRLKEISQSNKDAASSDTHINNTA